MEGLVRGDKKNGDKTNYTLDTPVPDGKGGILKMIPKHEVTYEKIDFPEGDKCYKHLKDQPFALY